MARVLWLLPKKNFQDQKCDCDFDELFQKKARPVIIKDLLSFFFFLHFINR
jgi:hypothetical protein